MTEPNRARPDSPQGPRSGSQRTCVELSRIDGHVAIRNPHDPEGEILILQDTAWRMFVEAVKHGEFEV